MSPFPLVLGTAQLGLPYGIANKTGQPNQSVATAIIREAWENGIQEFDTAQGYGESEQVLGKSLLQLKLAGKVRVITKPHPQLDHLNPDVLENAISASLKNIGVPQIYGIMLHREEMLSLWHKGLAETLSKLFAKGMFQKVGISVYAPAKAIEAINTEGIDMIQIPTNILDRRFEKTGVFELAKAKKKDVYIRSIFLQGLLLMNISEIPGKIGFAAPYIRKLESLSKELGLTRHEIALGYIKSEIPTGNVVFGAETKEQVTENLTAWKKNIPETLCERIKMTFSDVDERILNPFLWRK
ncbi:aldo/keto reductase [candidate division WS5 bacterium]|uniref:Aldo/keto reductase n=1 Tax=candidate division WS5 bacterium TaxID=2093353 RepID=A0A419DFA6_9BACT|nr:MAG: aldo/keto reductase [candidate division WS5 bacterium]